MHTPRLCIDGRATSQFAARGLIAQETIDELVSAQGEQGIGSEWIERQRTVLLSHPWQAFSGQLRRFDTRRRIGRSPFYGWWEKRFARRAHLSAFHRFRPADRLGPRLRLPTITTIFPATGKLPFYVSRQPEQWYVVPSTRDARLLKEKYSIPTEMVSVVRPGVRRYIHFSPAPSGVREGGILFLVGNSHADGARLNETVDLVARRFPELPRVELAFSRKQDVSPMRWMKLLQNTRLFFYLTEKPFDWPTLALEALFWNIPTVFPDGHAALSELLPDSPLKLSRYLVDLPGMDRLQLLADEARAKLVGQGVFEPLSVARQYAQIYSRLPRRIE
jgi:hypothetical protein